MRQSAKGVLAVSLCLSHTAAAAGSASQRTSTIHQQQTGFAFLRETHFLARTAAKSQHQQEQWFCFVSCPQLVGRFIVVDLRGERKGEEEGGGRCEEGRATEEQETRTR